MRLLSATFAAAFLAGCSSTAPVPGPPAETSSGPAPAAAPAAPATPRTMPAFQPSGLREDYMRVREAREATRDPRSKEDERAAAKRTYADLLTAITGKWAGREIPAPEALMYGSILKDAGMHVEAAVQVRRYLEVSPTDTNNYVNGTTMLVGCLAASGDFDGAAAELERAADGCYRGRDSERQTAETTLALALMKAGQLERAADRFDFLATFGHGDPESAIYGVDCWLRAGRPERAIEVATRAAAFFTEGRHRTRMEFLVREAEAIGKEAPDFSGARGWKGKGGPVTPEAMRGRVVVVFSFNLQVQWLRFFMKRVRALHEDLEPRGVLVVGIARLARFDPVKMAVREEMTAEEELDFFDRWAQQEEVRFPLAIGDYAPGALLMDAWLGNVIPCFVVVGRDGRISYVRTGKDEEHIAILRTMIDRALEDR